MSFTTQNKMQRFIFYSIFLFFFAAACNKDKIVEQNVVCTDEITFNNTIQPILSQSCGYSNTGCHDGVSHSDYNVYAGVLEDIEVESGKSFYNVVINGALVMPPGNTPSDRPQELTQEEYGLIKCWLDNGYPEQ